MQRLLDVASDDPKGNRLTLPDKLLPPYLFIYSPPRRFSFCSLLLGRLLLRDGRRESGGVGSARPFKTAIKEASRSGMAEAETAARAEGRTRARARPGPPRQNKRISDKCADRRWNAPPRPARVRPAKAQIKERREKKAERTRKPAGREKVLKSIIALLQSFSVGEGAGLERVGVKLPRHELVKCIKTYVARCSAQAGGFLGGTIRGPKKRAQRQKIKRMNKKTTTGKWEQNRI